LAGGGCGVAVDGNRMGAGVGCGVAVGAGVGVFGKVTGVGRCDDGGWCNRGNFSDGCRHPGINDLLDVGLGRTRGSTARRAGRDNNYANGPKDAN